MSNNTTEQRNKDAEDMYPDVTYPVERFSIRYKDLQHERRKAMIAGDINGCKRTVASITGYMQEHGIHNAMLEGFLKRLEEG